MLLDDVLSELDSNRQNYLLNSIYDTQTIITCTGLDDFVKKKENSSTREEKLQALKEIQSSYDSAVNEAFGLWKNHDNSISVDDYVRNMRKGRQFDFR